MGVFDQAATMGHEQVLFCNDKITGLRAIIAIHDTTLGPALGGLRMWNYESEEAALFDVLRLSRGMTYKASISDLNLGGGKVVIIGDPRTMKSEALFKTFGRFVNSLGGRYITAEDVNIRVGDIETVATETRYVSGTASRRNGSGDPSPLTALGVYHGIRAAVLHKLGKQKLENVRVAVQGCGAVGSHLAELLVSDGAKVFVSDIDEAKLRSVRDRLMVEVIDHEKIHAFEVDVFAPCALGGGLNDKTIPEVRAKIVAGGANNQLLDEARHVKALKQRSILYCPDYVINAGGLMNVYQELRGYDASVVREKVGGIFDKLALIFRAAEARDIPTLEAANQMAEDRIEAVRRVSGLRNTADSQYWALSKA